LNSLTNLANEFYHKNQPAALAAPYTTFKNPFDNKNNNKNGLQQNNAEEDEFIYNNELTNLWGLLKEKTTEHVGDLRKETFSELK